MKLKHIRFLNLFLTIFSLSLASDAIASETKETKRISKERSNEGRFALIPGGVFNLIVNDLDAISLKSLEECTPEMKKRVRSGVEKIREINILGQPRIRNKDVSPLSYLNFYLSEGKPNSTVKTIRALFGICDGWSRGMPFGDQDLKMIQSSFPSLTTIHVFDSSVITDQGLQTLIAGLPHLETLDLQNASSINGTGFNLLPPEHRLRTVRLLGLPSFNQDGLKALATKAGPHLETLELRHALQIQSPAFLLLNQFTGLRVLDLSLTNITGYELNELKLPRLNELYIDNVRGVSDENLASFADRHKELSKMSALLVKKSGDGPTNRAPKLKGESKQGAQRD